MALGDSASGDDAAGKMMRDALSLFIIRRSQPINAGEMARINIAADTAMVTETECRQPPLLTEMPSAALVCY